MTKQRNWRIKAVTGGIILIAAIIFVRLFYLQVLHGKFYQSQALGQQTGFAQVHGDRGMVYFANSKESRGARSTGEQKSLAINKTTFTAYAVPKNIADREVFAKSLAIVFDMEQEALLAKLRESETYVVLKKGLPEETVTEAKKLKLEGLSFDVVQERYYPQEQLAAQVIGFLGGGGVGQYGIEGHYEDVLKGKLGIRENRKGFDVIAAERTEDSLNGSDLHLTIDYNIQFQAESLLKEAAKNIDIDSGQIIVVKPDSGRILALANYPAFNPNDYSSVKNYGVFQNSAVQKIFEPGSVFKPFTMAMALHAGKVVADTTFNDTGSVTIGPDTIYNFDHEKYGVRNMSGILEKSINTGAVFLQQKVGRQVFANYLDKFGFTQKTGVDVQGEVSSRNAGLKNGSDFGFATASFGQGVEMTPIQLVQAFTAFANGGKMAKPYVVEKISYGGEEKVTQPVISDEIISPKTASEVTAMLINVVDKGFGNGAKIPGYYLAGKTGTAEVPIVNGKGYYADRTIQSFIGFGPALKPEFLILVKLDNPSVPKSALSAVPIFKKLAQYIINYWQIPPDYPVATK